jgi:hypothetical protein
VNLADLHSIRVTGSDVPQPIATFDELFDKKKFKKAYEFDLSDHLIENMKSYNFPSLTPIQMQVIPLMMNVNTPHWLFLFLCIYNEISFKAKTGASVLANRKWQDVLLSLSDHRSLANKKANEWHQRVDFGSHSGIGSTSKRLLYQSEKISRKTYSTSMIC